MRIAAPARPMALALAAILAFAALVSVPAESGSSLKGIVERKEGGRFLVDSAWVEPGKGARFSGTARNAGRIRVGDWVDADGKWGGGIFRAGAIKVSHDFPGHTFQGNLSRQGLAEADKLSKSKQAYRNPEA